MSILTFRTIAQMTKRIDGMSFTIVIESSNGSTFRMTDTIETTLRCRVYRNTEEITDDLQSWRFNWKRLSRDTSGDTRWNQSSKAIGNKSVYLTNDDVYGRSVFVCEVELD